MGGFQTNLNENEFQVLYRKADHVFALTQSKAYNSQLLTGRDDAIVQLGASKVKPKRANSGNLFTQADEGKTENLCHSLS